MKYTHINPHFGIDVHDDVRTLTDADRAELIDLIAKYKVLRFKAPNLKPNELVKFSEIMGECWSSESGNPLAGNGESDSAHPETSKITLVSNNPEKRGVLSDMEVTWHNDVAHRPWDIPGGTLPFRILYGEEVSEYSSPTSWIDQEWLYDNCPKDLRDELEDVIAWYEISYPTDWKGCRRKIVLESPITGRKALTMETLFLRGFEGYSHERFVELRDEVMNIATQPENVIVHNWQHGDLIVNTNYAAGHYRPRIDNEYTRILWRTTFQIDELIPKKFI